MGFCVENLAARDFEEFDDIALATWMILVFTACVEVGFSWWYAPGAKHGLPSKLEMCVVLLIAGHLRAHDTVCAATMRLGSRASTENTPVFHEQHQLSPFRDDGSTLSEYLHLHLGRYGA